jgi:phosphoribosylanthranilate isomerase
LRVKICGITNFEDAIDAVLAGADALGFVFYEKSPRYIDPKEAEEIIRKLPPFVQSIGLFVNKKAEEVDQICKESAVDMAQIHFDADKEFYNTLQNRYIKVIRVQNKQDIVNLDPHYYYLVDAFVESYGGEGKRIALEWFEGIDCSNLILAGGLNAANLKELKGYNFYGVDVSSGVERSKGKKEKQKMIDFVQSADELSQ